MWDAFTTISRHAIDLYVPLFNTSLNSAHRNKLGNVQSKEMRTCEKKKRQLWRKIKRFPNNALTRSKYRQCTFEWQQLVRKRHRDIEEHIIDSNDLGSFYKYIYGRIGKRFNNGAIHNPSKIVDTDEEKADDFDSYFHLLELLTTVLYLLLLRIIITKTWKTLMSRNWMFICQ